MPPLITVATVARSLGVSRVRVHQLDPILGPRRSETGVRIYDLARLDHELGRRTAIGGSR